MLESNLCSICKYVCVHKNICNVNLYVYAIGILFLLNIAI